MEIEIPNEKKYLSKANIFDNWKGKNKFFCFGYILISTVRGNLLLVLTTLFGQIFVYHLHYFYVGKFLIENYSHFYSYIAKILISFTIFFFIYSSFREPGYLPRGNVSPPEIIEKQSLLKIGIDNENDDLAHKNGKKNKV